MDTAYKEALHHLGELVIPGRPVTPRNRLDTDNWELLTGLLSFPCTDILEELRNLLREITGREHVYFAPSCRAAIAQILSLLPQRQAVLPSYTCPVVRDAVRFAGKDAVYVDISLETLNSTSNEFKIQAIPGRVLIPTHLYGIPTDVEAICRLAKEQGCVTIEDAAAVTLGSTHNGRRLGTLADFGVFSFERSKRLPAFRGAVIVVNNERIIDPARLATHRITTKSRSSLPIRETLRALTYNLATMPWIFGHLVLPVLLHRSTQGRELQPRGESAFNDAVHDSAYYAREFHPYQAWLVLQMLRRLTAIRDHIGRLVAVYRSALQKTAIASFVSKDCELSGLLRFPVVFKRLNRTDALALALKRGLFLETNYERPLPNPNLWPNYPNALWAAENVILLPLYRSLSCEAASQLVTELVSIADESFSSLRSSAQVVV